MAGVTDGTRGAGSDLDRFAETYLQHWEERSTVRAARRTQITEAMAAHDLYPPTFDFLSLHPRVAALGEETRRFLLTQAAYGFMQEIALLETDTVGLLAAALSHRDHRVTLSPAVRQAALTVSVDEAYHAFAACEFIDRAVELTGIAPVALPRDLAQIGIAHAAARGAVPREAADDYDVVILCIAENVITREILGMTEGSPPDNAFHVACDEHLVDETRHNGYFQRVLRHYWGALDDGTREAIGVALPHFMTGYLGDDTRFRGRSIAVLRGAGLDEAGANEVVADIFRPYPLPQNPMARNVIRLLERTGVLDHAPTREAVARGGWIG